MARGRADRMELNHLAERLGAPLREAEPVGWGDARATYRLTLADDRRFAARRFAGPEQYARAERIGRLMTGLAQVGLPVQSPTIVDTPGARWLVTAWVEGETGASWLADPDRARHLADRMGKLASRLRGIDLATTVDLGGRSVAEVPDTRKMEPLAFVHGDFAPVNVVMRADGEIGALLDFEHAGAGPALLDIAWWGWVVRHHHPEAWRVAWPMFLAAAGLEPGHELRLHDLVLQTLADRASASRDEDDRGRWLDRLTVARSWTVSGDQAT